MVAGVLGKSDFAAERVVKLQVKGQQVSFGSGD